MSASMKWRDLEHAQLSSRAVAGMAEVEVSPQEEMDNPQGMNECFYDSPPPNRRLHEPENREYLPLQAAKLKKKKCAIDLHLQIHPHEQAGSTSKKVKRMREKRRGISFEIVAGMGGLS